MKYKPTLSVSEAAKRLGISRQALYGAIERGDIKARKKIETRTVYRIPEDEIESFTVNATRQAAGLKNTPK